MVGNPELLDKLNMLYHDQSKHAVYQDVPLFVRRALGYSVALDEQWRGVSARWEYMRRCMEFDQERILDVGANTGFFALNLAHEFPQSHCTALEGNPNHVEFIRTVAEYFELPNVEVLRQYLDYDTLDALSRYDTILLFNVLHHAGVDFDRELVADEQDLYGYLVRYLGRLRVHCRRLVFQIGYNWGGNKQYPVVSLQDDAGKCVYNSKVFRQAGWVIEKILLPSICQDDLPIVHRGVSRELIALANGDDDELFRQSLATELDPDMVTMSEFYRRPIFICRS